MLRGWMLILCTAAIGSGAAWAASEIKGTVFDDQNRNGFQDGSEPGLDGITVYLDTNLDGVHNSPGESSVLTSGGGHYSFADPGAGDYRIGVVVPAGRSVTYPSYPLKKVGKFRSGTDDYGDVWGDGNLAAMGTYTDGGTVQLVDISDPAAPVLAGGWEEGADRVGPRHEGAGSGSQYEDVVIKEGVGYFASNTGLGVHIVDISDPANATTLAHIDDHNGGANSIHNLWLDGSFLYFVTNKTLTVYVFDVSDPANPSKVREFAANAPAGAKRIHEATVKDGRLYLAINPSSAEETTAGVELLETEIWDVSDVENSVAFLGSYNSGYSTHTVWPTDNGLYAISAREPYPWEGAEGDISIWSISDPANATELARLRADEMGFGDVTAHIPFVVGNLLYVSWYWAGVKVFDLTDPAHPALIGGYDTSTRTGDYQGCWGVYPFLGADKVLASDIENGLFILAPGLPGGHYIEKEDGADSEFNHFGLAVDEPAPGDAGWRIGQAKYTLNYAKGPGFDALTLQAKLEFAALQNAGLNLANLGAHSLQLDFGGAALPAAPLAATSATTAQVAWQTPKGVTPKITAKLNLSTGILTFSASGADLQTALGAPFAAAPQTNMPQPVAVTVTLGDFEASMLLETAYSHKSATATGTGSFKWGSPLYDLPDGLCFVEKATLQQKTSKGTVLHRVVITIAFKPAGGAAYDPRPDGAAVTIGAFTETAGNDPLLTPFVQKGTAFVYTRPKKTTAGAPAALTGIQTLQFQPAKWLFTATSHWMPAGAFGPLEIGAGAPATLLLPVELEVDGISMGAEALLRLSKTSYVKK